MRLGIPERWRPGMAGSDEALIAQARAGRESAVRTLVQRHNARLFRIARAVVRDDAEAEDIVQETYVRAFTALDSFRGDAAFTTWLTRIALNEARGRLRRRRPAADLAEIDARCGPGGGEVIMFPTIGHTPGPESEAGREQVRRLLERAVDELPEPFRMVFILRDVQGLSTGETAEALSIRPETVKTRLHRARQMMKASLERSLAPQFRDLFPFAGERCARMADGVIACLRPR